MAENGGRNGGGGWLGGVAKTAAAGYREIKRR